jgi:hypothetical protein
VLADILRGLRVAAHSWRFFRSAEASMKLFGAISDMLRRQASGPRGVALSGLGEQVIRKAEIEGYRVTRSSAQGPEAIVLERNAEGSIFLWSNEDVIAYGRSKKWI